MLNALFNGNVICSLDIVNQYGIRESTIEEYKNQEENEKRAEEERKKSKKNMRAIREKIRENKERSNDSSTTQNTKSKTSKQEISEDVLRPTILKMMKENPNGQWIDGYGNKWSVCRNRGRLTYKYWAFFPPNECKCYKCEK